MNGICFICAFQICNEKSLNAHEIRSQHTKNCGNSREQWVGVVVNNFEILKKCQSKLDCLIFEMFFIRKLKPKLNKQSDWICAKLFTQRFFIIHAAIFFACLHCFYVNSLEFQSVSYQHFYNRLYIFQRIQNCSLFNLRMTVERSKRSYVLTLTFIVTPKICRK